MTTFTAHNQTELDAILSPTDADQAAEALWSHNVVAAMAREA